MKVLADWWRRSGLLGADSLVDRAEVVRRITAVGDSGEGLGLAWATDCSVGVFVQLYALATRRPRPHFRGVVSAVRAHSYLVKFPEVDGKWTRPWTVAEDRLFSIAGA